MVVSDLGAEELAAALEHNRLLLSALLDGVRDGVTVQRADGRLVFANPAAARLMGFSSPGELLATPLEALRDSFILLDEFGRPVPVERLPGRLALSGVSAPEQLVRFRLRHREGERLSRVSAAPVRDRLGVVQYAVNVIRDVTDEERLHRSVRFLSEAGVLLSASLEIDVTLEAVARLVVPDLADGCSVVLSTEAGPQPIAVAHVDPAKVALAREFQRRYPPGAETSRGVGRVLATGESEWTEVITEAHLRAGARDEEQFQTLKELGLQSAMIVPMKGAERVVGAITLISAESGRRFTLADLTLAEELGRRAAQAVENARYYDASRQAERRLQLALEAGRLGAWELDVVSGRVAWSPSLERIHGIPEGSFPGTLEADQADLHPEDRERVVASMGAALAGSGDDYLLLYRIIRRAGEVRWLEARGIVSRAASGEALRLTGVCSDVTDRIATQERQQSLLKEQFARAEAERSRARIAEILASITDPFFVLDPHGVVTYANAAVKTWAPGVGPGFDMFLHGEVGQVVEETCRGALAALQVERRELFVTGLSRWLQVTAYPMSDGFSVYSRDVTARREAEVQLELRARELARSNADLEQFAYVASHDLQEPLRMVSSFVQLLGRRYSGKLDADADEFIGFAVDGVSRMQTLIQDLLAYSRLGTRGKAFASLPLERALTSALDNLQLAIAEASASVSHDSLPRVTGDLAQLTQVFQNLLGNAIKFRGDTPPRLHVGAEASGREVTISVRDNGIGIDPAYFDRIFIIFQRLHGRSAHSGNGIGLAICKKVVERHGGRIWVESAPGEGTTFFFTLPLADD